VLIDVDVKEMIIKMISKVIRLYLDVHEREVEATNQVGEAPEGREDLQSLWKP